MGENFSLKVFKAFGLKRVLVIGAAAHERPDTVVAPDPGGIVPRVPGSVGELMVVVDIKGEERVVPDVSAVIDGVTVSG